MTLHTRPMLALDLPRAMLALPGVAMRRTGRALDDLALLASLAARAPGALEIALQRVDLALDEVGALITEARALHVDVATVNASATRVAEVGVAIHDGGEDLLEEMKLLHADARALHDVAVALHDGGEDLLEATRRIDARLAVFEAALPQLLSGVKTAQALGESVESVAETIEPLHGAAEKVGRLTRRSAGRG